MLSCSSLTAKQSDACMTTPKGHTASQLGIQCRSPGVKMGEALEYALVTLVPLRASGLGPEGHGHGGGGSLGLRSRASHSSGDAVIFLFGPAPRSVEVALV